MPTSSAEPKRAAEARQAREAFFFRPCPHGRRISYACWLNRVRLVPHSWGTPIRIAAELHWCANFPSSSKAWNAPPVMFELHHPHECPAWGLAKKRIEVDKSDGLIPVPTAPGLGIEINLAELEKHRIAKIEIA
ncbi:MAG: hypothetical protein JST93_05295 [Acidobacteria bacterium]|nr:hypothetical protein [Acidobacteriota bacterium]